MQILNGLLVFSLAPEVQGDLDSLWPDGLVLRPNSHCISLLFAAFGVRGRCVRS